jgi:channel protein (hemolysin III family)
VWALCITGVIKECVSCKRGGLLSSLIFLGMAGSAWWRSSRFSGNSRRRASRCSSWAGRSIRLGVVFYLWRRLRFHHAIWHLFVLGGSAGHWAAIMTFSPSSGVGADSGAMDSGSRETLGRAIARRVSSFLVRPSAFRILR